MNVRELLEAAAKAEGRTLKYMTQHIEGREPETFIACWNPLADDGDAFRLAVKLGMYTGLQSVSVWSNGQELLHIFQDGDDPYSATRRAIVKAAAAMGKITATL